MGIYFYYVLDMQLLFGVLVVDVLRGDYGETKMLLRFNREYHEQYVIFVRKCITDAFYSFHFSQVVKRMGQKANAADRYRVKCSSKIKSQFSLDGFDIDNHALLVYNKITI